MAKAKTLGILIGIGLALLAVGARAEDHHEGHFSAATLTGYGFEGLGLGLGARSGYTFSESRVYFGGTFVYHLAEWDRASDNGFYFGPELGVDIGDASFTVRPYLGIGDVPARAETATSADPRTGVSHSESHLINMLGLWGGAALLYHAGHGFVGVDPRVLVVRNALGPSVFLTAGVEF